MRPRILLQLATLVMLAGCGAHTQRAAVGNAPRSAALPLLKPAAHDYDVDTKRSRFEVWGTDVFGTDHRITFGRWKAHVTTGDAIAIAAEVDVSTAAVDIASANGLLREKLLEAHRFPLATLNATMTSTGKKTNEVLVAGTTELHGVTKELSFTGLLRQEGENYRFDAAFVLDRQTFGIHYGPAEPFLRDDVRLVIDVVAVPSTTSAAGSSALPAPPDAGERGPSGPQ